MLRQENSIRKLYSSIHSPGAFGWVLIGAYLKGEISDKKFINNHFSINLCRTFRSLKKRAAASVRNFACFPHAQYSNIIPLVACGGRAPEGSRDTAPEGSRGRGPEVVLGYSP